MYVKSLTMKGFKSFASATHLRLEPGITCIVGPNGSGKSNVVDALAWVMGEQGAKSLRGGSMEDVIFAGTAGRPPLGRAEVALTIDNTDGALPIDYTEVTISRTMFRSGGSEYAINGTSCRLLDIQELLSDSGIGREMHVIVGQGQLDAVLRATPEERRGFIEEAAGVLKHRKRKERALRKLESMEANLTRITDLTGEIRRQLGPLGRQAETARKAAVIQAEVRDARLRVLADDLVQLTSTLEQEVADETALIARRTEVEDGLTGLGSRVAELESAAEAARPELSQAQDRWYALARLTERLTATGSLATERVRLLRQDLADEARDAGSGASSRDPEELRRQAAELLHQHEALVVEIADATAALEAAVAQRADVEQAYAAEQQRLARVARAVADRREGLARLAGQVAAKASRIEAAEGEIGRMHETVGAARARAAQAEREFAALESSIAAEEAGEEDLDAGYEQAAAHLDRLQAELEELQEAERSAERDRQSFTARVDALDMSLRRKDGAAALLAAGDDTHTIAGSVASLVQVEAGHEVAVAAALGWAGDALAVDTLAGAAAAVDRLRSDDAGRAGLLVAETAGSVERSGWPSLPRGARWAVDVVSCSDRLRPAVDRLLERVALVDSCRRGRGAGSRRGDRGDARRRRVRARLGSRRERRRPEPHRDPGRRRRGPRPGHRSGRPGRARPVRHGLAADPGGRGVRRRRGRPGPAARLRREDVGRRREARRPRRGGTQRAVRGRAHGAGHRCRRGGARQRPDRARGARGTLRGRRRAAGHHRCRRGHRRARPARRRRDRRSRPRDRAATRTAHPRGAGPRPARPSDRPRGGGRGRDRGPGPARGPAAAPPARGGGGRGGPRGRRLRRRSRHPRRRAGRCPPPPRRGGPHRA